MGDRRWNIASAVSFLALLILLLVEPGTSNPEHRTSNIEHPGARTSVRFKVGAGKARVSLTACSETSRSPREGTRPTWFSRRPACIVGPVPSPGGFAESRPLRKATFLRTEVRAPLARAAITLNRY